MHVESKKLQFVFLSIIISIGVYFAFVFYGGIHDVIKAMAGIGFFGFSLVLFLSLGNYVFRFIRWQIYLGILGYKIPLFRSMLIYFGGFSLTTTPGKAGEVLRSVYLVADGVSYKDSLAAFFSERMSDLIAVVVITFFAIASFPDYIPIIFLVSMCVFCVLSILMANRLQANFMAYLQARHGKLWRFLLNIMGIVVSAKECNKPKIFFLSGVIGFVAWASEAVGFYYLLNFMGEHIDLSVAMSIYAIAMLAGAISFLPGGIGGTEIVMTALLLMCEVDQASAVAATVLIRVATLWFAVGIGFVSIFILSKGVGSYVKNQ